MVKTTLNIDGMMCSMCETHINEAIRKAVGVKKVRSYHKKGCSVIISEDPLDEDDIRQAIADTGYELKGISSEPYKKTGLFSHI